MPAPRRRFLAAPPPAPPVRDVNPQRTARALAQGAAAPLARAEPGDQLVYRGAVYGGLLLAGRTASRRLWRRNVQPRRFAPDPLRAMNIGNKSLAHVVQRAQEGGLLAVAAVHSHPAEPRPPRPCRTHHLQRKIRLGAHLARLCRDLGPVASRRVIDPALRQVEPHVDRRVRAPSVSTANTATWQLSTL